MKKTFRDFHLLQILKRFEFKNSLDRHLNRYFKAHKAIGSKDRRVIGDTIYGIIRWQGLIDSLISTKNWDNRLVCYQQINPYDYLDKISLPLHIRTSFPKSLFALLAKEYGEKKTKKLALVCNTPAPTTIRINPLKTTRIQFVKAMESSYNIERTSISPLGIKFIQKVSLVQLPEFKEGLFELQDEGSQLVNRLVQPTPGDLVLDYCSGSGGKTLGFAHLLEGKGQIFLHDIRENVLALAKKRLKRAGIQNCQLLYPQSANLNTLKKKMDWVVVDVPCSGTGTLRRNPEMKWRFSYQLLKDLQAEQRMIFEKALSFVKPGGKIVYMTCSLLQAENEDQITYFLKTYNLSPVGSPLKLLPIEGGMDGFFGAVFSKSIGRCCTNNH